MVVPVPGVREARVLSTRRGRCRRPVQDLVEVERDVGVGPVAADLERAGAVIADLAREAEELAAARGPDDAQVPDRGRAQVRQAVAGGGRRRGRHDDDKGLRPGRRWRRADKWPFGTLPSPSRPKPRVGAAGTCWPPWGDGGHRPGPLRAAGRAAQHALAQADRGRHLDQLIDRDELEAVSSVMGRGGVRRSARRGMGPDLVSFFPWSGRRPCRRAGCSRRRPSPRRPRSPARSNSVARS